MNQDQVVQLLQSRGVVPTAQRIDVARVIWARPQHLSADQVMLQLREAGSRVSKTTVYNTLNLFCAKGLLRTVEVDPTRQFYDSMTDPHHHFYNVDTGELTDIPLDAIRLVIDAPLPLGTREIGVDVVIRVQESR